MAHVKIHLGIDSDPDNFGEGRTDPEKAAVGVLRLWKDQLSTLLEEAGYTFEIETGNGVKETIECDDPSDEVEIEDLITDACDFALSEYDRLHPNETF